MIKLPEDPFDDRIFDPKFYIKKIIESRILGTGVHLTIPKKRQVCISYRQIRIWGIKNALIKFIDILYFKIISKLNLNKNQITGKIIEKRIIDLREEFNIPKRILNERLDRIKAPAKNWNYMSKELKIAVIINAFIDSIDESFIMDLAKRRNHNKTLAEVLDRFNPNSPKIIYELEDFGFVFRARVYVTLLSKEFYNNAFSNVIRRIDSALKQLYMEYFVQNKRNEVRKADIQRLDSKIHQEILKTYRDLMEKNK
ncbi:MAG: hypothetical protein GF364_03550 [Candidatus Lokiarchaeota archaeon]|nr:hypothetical protein [Candidatus Lokiarchaeota archaeon]